MMRVLLVLCFLCSRVSGAERFNQILSLQSPNDAVEFRVLSSDGPALHYAVKFHRRDVIQTSPLSFNLDGVDLTKGSEGSKIGRNDINQTYPWRGNHSRATNRCNEAEISFGAPNGTHWSLEARAYDDGAAFRFVVPDNGKSRAPDEASQFILPSHSTVWFHDLEGHYEGVHVKKDAEKIETGEWAAPPVTFKLPAKQGYASITEAALLNYSGMALQADGPSSFSMRLAHKHPASYPYRLRYSSNDVERLSKPATISGTITTPWRVIVVSRDLNGLVNSDILPNLCPPPDPKLFPEGVQTSWVKPGRAVWKYIDGGESSIEGTKEFCRLAGELGFEYNVIEGYWSRWSDDEIRDVVSYARQRGVGLWFWKHSRSLRTPEAREEFFGKLERFGVVGAKIDFLDHEHKEVIDLYNALRADAAKHRVLVNFHGSNKPTGETRTWPNELTREAIKGMESRKIPDRATHDATLPFTRYLAGAGDYTVMHFGERRGNTTWAHQIATAAVFQMPLLTYVANPATILTNPAVEVIKAIPAVWDETIVLPDSEIGELAAFARRSGNQWFLAAMNGPKARTIEVRLSFLPKGVSPGVLVRDDPENSNALKLERGQFKRGDSVKIALSGGGGFVAKFEK